MAKVGPELLPDEVLDPPELVFRWRRFRFPSFKFFVVLLGAIVVHLAGFYLFELAQSPETKTTRQEANVLILRSEDPESNRVLLAHFDAMNAYEVELNAGDIIDTGVRLAPSFVDYSLQPLAMPENKSELTEASFPAFTESSLIHLVPKEGRVTSNDGAEAGSAPWSTPDEVTMICLDTAEEYQLPVSWNDEFWSQNFGRSVVFDLGIDSRGVVRVAMGGDAVPEVLQAVRNELIGHRLPVNTENVSPRETIWKRCRIEFR